MFTVPDSATGAVIAEASGDADAIAEAGGLDTVSVLLLLHAAAAINAMPATAQNLRTTHLPLDELHPGERTKRLLSRFPNGGFRTQVTTLPYVTQQLWTMDATEIADLVRGGEISAKEVLEAHIERIEQHNDTLNAIIHLDLDGAWRRRHHRQAHRVA